MAALLRSRRSLLSLAVVSALAVGATVGGCSGKFGIKGDDPVVPPPGPRPAYGPTVTAAKPPPPISGGTLVISKSGELAFAADADRDRVSIVKLASGEVSHVELKPGDEPGRSVEDGANRLHVVLRSAGAIATIDAATKTVTMRRSVCAVPRGIAHDPTSDLLYVACVGGELVTLPAAGGEATQLANLDFDLRDVLITKGRIYVSRFRTATLLEVDTKGNILNSQSSPPRTMRKLSGNTLAAVAWKLVADPYGQVVMVHQRVRDPNAEPVPVTEGGYTTNNDDPTIPGGGGGTVGEGDMPSGPSTSPTPMAMPACNVGIVQSAVTTFNNGASSSPTSGAPISNAVLPVDVAIDRSFNVVVIAAGNGKTPELLQVNVLRNMNSFAECAEIRPGVAQPKGQAIAAAFDPSGRLVVQTREPATLVYYQPGFETPSTFTLATDSHEDTGHSIFHSNAGGFMACASCHPEGGDDGQVWNFADSGPRRTQTFRGGLSGTEPFHWNGDLHDISALMGEVFTKRMSGAQLDGKQLGALTHWIDTVPLLHTAPTGDAAKIAKIERGRALFNDGTTGCASCHTGSKLTNNTTVDVGTGSPFQVPSLRGLAFRAPYMHDGCAQTLLERFSGTTCGGGEKHGHTSHLKSDQVQDLIAYLQTL